MFTEELSEDPDLTIYPTGDDRNPDDPGAGMSGASRETTAETPVPGETFSLTGCIDDSVCIELYGEDGCHSIGAELFQTVGFMGGEVTAAAQYWKFQIGGEYFYSETEVEGATEVTMYTVSTPYGDQFVSACDLTEYSVGEWVALAKPDMEFPVNEYSERVAVTSDNVPEAGTDEYVIIPYQFVGV